MGTRIDPNSSRTDPGMKIPVEEGTTELDISDESTTDPAFDGMNLLEDIGARLSGFLGCSC